MPEVRSFVLPRRLRRRRDPPPPPGSRPVKQLAEIRSTFLEFFASKGHTVVPSSPVVPGDDPTLLFTNAAGMPNQFKDDRSSPAWASRQAPLRARGDASQKCIRAGGGKVNNDLVRTSPTRRATTRSSRCWATSSFGDYFKKDALKFACSCSPRSTSCRPTSFGRRSTPRTTRPTTSGRTRSACRPSGSCASATTRARVSPPTTSG